MPWVCGFGVDLVAKNGVGILHDDWITMAGLYFDHKVLAALAPDV